MSLSTRAVYAFSAYSVVMVAAAFVAAPTTPVVQLSDPSPPMLALWTTAFAVQLVATAYFLVHYEPRADSGVSL